jgi:hypothetical protein
MSMTRSTRRTLLSLSSFLIMGSVYFAAPASARAENEVMCSWCDTECPSWLDCWLTCGGQHDNAPECDGPIPTCQQGKPYTVYCWK